jgi:hypothetical protein
MRANIPPEVFQAYLDQEKAAEARASRITARSVLAEMVRQDAAEKRLTWRRRKALVRFAEKLGLDAYEAQLLIRAAEFSFDRCADEKQATVAREYLAALEEPARTWATIGVALAAVTVNYALIMLWMRWRG